MQEIRDFITNNFDEKTLVLFVGIGIGLLLLCFLIPKGKQLYRIDAKRILSADKVQMSAFNRYIYSLSLFNFINILLPKENSKKYKQCDKKIKKTGGLNGCCPEVIFTLKWLLFIFVLVVDLILLFVSSFQSTLVMICSIAMALTAFYFPDMFLNYKIKAYKIKLLNELETIELFATIYLSSGYGIFELLKALTEVTVYTKDYIQECLNEFYTNQERALQHLSDKIDLDEYQLLIDIFKQSIKFSSKDSVSFVDDHMNQLEKIKELSLKEQDKKNPFKYLLVLMLPFGSIIILWIYPLMLRAINVFSVLNSGF